MAKIITENFRVKNAEDFYNTLNTDDYFVVASAYSADSEAGITNSLYDKIKFLNRVLFGNRVDKNDCRFLFSKRPWVEGTVYDHFDDRIDVSTLNMFVTVLDGTDSDGYYRVYKCIDNNNGSQSVVKPNIVPNNSEDDGYFTTSEDGYTWKYMFSVPSSEYQIFQTRDNLPYVPDVDMINNANDGIYRIAIESRDANSYSLFTDYMFKNETGLAEYVLNSVSGEIAGDDDSNFYCDITVTAAQVTENIRTLDNSYVGMYIEVEGKLYDIVQSKTRSAQAPTVEVEMRVRGDLRNSARICYLRPKVIVSNSNNSSDFKSSCKAVAMLDEFGGITGIRVVNYGYGYTQAEAKLSLPAGIADKSGSVTLRPIISSLGGHGANPILELQMSKVAVVSTFYSSDDTLIPANGSYTQVGLVRNPEFTVDMSTRYDFDSRIKATLSGDISALVEIGDILEQTVDGEIVSAKVHEINVDGGNTILSIADYSGAYSGSFVEGTNANLKKTEDDLSPITVTINSIETSEYVNGTGTLLHFTDFDAITRASETKEKIKFIFDF